MGEKIEFIRTQIYKQVAGEVKESELQGKDSLSFLNLEHRAQGGVPKSQTLDCPPFLAEKAWGLSWGQQGLRQRHRGWSHACSHK